MKLLLDVNIPLKYEKLLAEQVVEMISAAIINNLNELKRGAILSIDMNRARVRLLPL